MTVVNESIKLKYTLCLFKESNSKNFKTKLQDMKVQIKSQLNIAPVFVVIATDDQLDILKKCPEIKKIEDEFNCNVPLISK